MKNTIYILALLFIVATVTACTPDTITEASDRIESTWGEDDNNEEDQGDQEEGN